MRKQVRTILERLVEKSEVLDASAVASLAALMLLSPDFVCTRLVVSDALKRLRVELSSLSDWAWAALLAHLLGKCEGLAEGVHRSASALHRSALLAIGSSITRETSVRQMLFALLLLKLGGGEGCVELEEKVSKAI